MKYFPQLTAWWVWRGQFQYSSTIRCPAIIIPKIRRFIPSLLAEEIVGVQPMDKDLISIPGVKEDGTMATWWKINKYQLYNSL